MAKIYYGNQEISSEQYIDSEHLNDNAVITSKIADNAVTGDKIADGAITDSKLASGVISEIDSKQDELISGENIKTVNGKSILGSGDLSVTTYQTFNPNWKTNGTTKEFCDDVNADVSAVVGMAYLGGVTFSDFPATGLLNADVVVDIIATTAGKKVIRLTLTSGSVTPYHWEYTYWNNGNNVSGWKSWQIPLIAGNNITISNSGRISATDTTYTAGANINISANNKISATDTTYSAGTGLSLDGTEFNIDTSVVATQNDLTGKQDVLTAGNNIEINNNVISATDSTYAAGNGLSLSGDEFSIDTSVVATQQDLSEKQDTLVSGTNIKTINNESILGSGDIQIEGVSDYNDLENIPIININETVTYENGKYYRQPEVKELNQLRAGDVITNYTLSKDNDPVGYLSQLTYSQTYPGSSNNTYLMTGQTGGVASVVTANGTVSTPGDTTTTYTSEGKDLLLATKSQQFGTMAMFIIPILGGHKLYFDVSHSAPSFTSSSLTWQVYGSETDEFANCNGGSSASFIAFRLTLGSCVASTKSLVAFRHDNGDSTYSYKLYISDYSNGHDQSGQISGILIYDDNTSGWQNNAVFDDNVYVCWCNMDDPLGIIQAVSLTPLNGTDYYTLYQGRPLSGDGMSLDALYHSSGEDLIFLSSGALSFADQPVLCYNVFDNEGWVKGYYELILNISAQQPEDMFVYQDYVPYSVTDNTISGNLTIEAINSTLPVYTGSITPEKICQYKDNELKKILIEGDVKTDITYAELPDKPIAYTQESVRNNGYLLNEIAGVYPEINDTVSMLYVNKSNPLNLVVDETWSSAHDFDYKLMLLGHTSNNLYSVYIYAIKTNATAGFTVSSYAYHDETYYTDIMGKFFGKKQFNVVSWSDASDMYIKFTNSTSIINFREDTSEAFGSCQLVIDRKADEADDIVCITPASSQLLHCVSSTPSVVYDASMIDTSPTQSSTNLLTSGGIYTALSNTVSQLSGSAGIAFDENDIITLKAGITETNGIIDNSTGSNITLAKVAKTGNYNDLTNTPTPYAPINGINFVDTAELQDYNGDSHSSNCALRFARANDSIHLTGRFTASNITSGTTYHIAYTYSGYAADMPIHDSSKLIQILAHWGSNIMPDTDYLCVAYNFTTNDPVGYIFHDGQWLYFLPTTTISSSSMVYFSTSYLRKYN